MKTLRMLLPVMLLMMASCTKSTNYGSCIGIMDDEQPNLQYKLSIWNTFLAVFFSETIVVPIVVVAGDAKCPVGPRYKQTN